MVDGWRDSSANRAGTGKFAAGRRRAFRLGGSGFGYTARPEFEKEKRMVTLRSYVQDRWVEGQGALAVLVNPATEELVARFAGYQYSSAT